jgi:hypothetical protein
MIRARSSESSLTMVLTVEYKIGLAHPETPNRYQAKNLRQRLVSTLSSDKINQDYESLLQTRRNIPYDHA